MSTLQKILEKDWEIIAAEVAQKALKKMQEHPFHYAKYSQVIYEGFKKFAKIKNSSLLQDIEKKLPEEIDYDSLPEIYRDLDTTNCIIGIQLFINWFKKI